MLSKQQLIGMLVGLKRVNDIDLVEDRAVLNHRVCLEGDILLVRRMAGIVNELYDTFNYSRSPEFLRSIEGKSAEFKSMREKLLTPAKRNEIQRRLDQALEQIMSSDEVFELIEPGRQERIKELRNLLGEVSNPN
jgi:hypothetical protein